MSQFFGEVLLQCVGVVCMVSMIVAGVFAGKALRRRKDNR